MAGLRVVLVGAGWMGSRHARAVNANGDGVASVIDRMPERARVLAGEVGARSLSRLEDLDPRSVDAAVVATPTADHSTTTRYLLDLGLPVLVEKPHRLPFEDAWSEHRGDPLCWVGMTTRFQEGFSAARRAIHEGALGEVRWWADRIWYHLRPGALPEWYFDQSTAGGGILTTNGVHALDRVNWMLGDFQLRSVRTGTVFPDHSVEDAAVLQGEVGTAEVEISLLWGSARLPPSELVVVGTRGTATVRPGTGWIFDTRNGMDEGTEPSDEEEPFRRQWSAFVRALHGEVDDPPTWAALEPVLRQIELAYERIREDT